MFAIFRGVRFVHTGALRKDTWTCCGAKMSEKTRYCMNEEAVALTKAVGVTVETKNGQIHVTGMPKGVRVVDMIQAGNTGKTTSLVVVGIGSPENKRVAITPEKLRDKVDDWKLQINAKEKNIVVGTKGWFGRDTSSLNSTENPEDSEEAESDEHVSNGKVVRIENGHVVVDIDGREEKYTLEKTLELLALGSEQMRKNKTGKSSGKKKEGRI